MNYAILITILAVVAAAALMKESKPAEIKSTSESEPTYESFSQKVSVEGKYELIFPPNGYFIRSPISRISPNYTLEQFRTIFSRFLHIIEQYNNFSEIRQQREDEELEDLLPINILDVQFDITLPTLACMSTYNNNRMIATMNFISATLVLTKQMANDHDIKKITERLKKGFKYDPMSAVQIYAE
jgi:hypothetical protein